MDNIHGKYDTVIVGGGLAGLSCASMLTKAGRRVILLEKNHRLGGYAVSYTIKGHRFDIAIQAIGGCDPDGTVYRFLKEINREESIKFLPCEPARVYFMDHSDTPWIQSGSWSANMEELCNRFPPYRESLKKCYDTWSGILAELEGIASPGSGNAAFRFSRTCPLLARYGTYTVKEFLDELKLPPDLQSLLAARSGYCMLPLKRLSLVGFACTEMTYSEGAWMVEGGIESLTRTLIRAILDQGGRIERRARVSSIVTRGGEVQGAATDEGRFFPARSVVVASAARPAFEHWLDSPDLIPPRYLKKMISMETTGSYYIAYYSLPSEAVDGLWPNIEVRINHNALMESWSPDLFYMLIPSMVDPAAAPIGSHSLCLSLPCPIAGPLGRSGRLLCRRFLEKAVERRFPQLKGRMTFLFELAPEQLSAISGNPGGSAYGWAQTPEQSGIRRLNIKTPVQGLFLAGHWTMPGGGIAGVITSGRLCAGAVLKEL